MLTQKNIKHFLNLKWLSKLRAAKPNIWQMKLLDAKGLAKFSELKGLYFSERDINVLWKLGLLKADLIQSSKKLKLNRLSEVGINEIGHFLYSDEYNLPRKKKGWLGAAYNMKHINKDIKLFFHPFRYYMLYRIIFMQHIGANSMQMLYYSKLNDTSKSWNISYFRRWSKTVNFRELINKWTFYTNLAIATELTVSSDVFRRDYYNSDNWGELKKERRSYWQQLKPKLSKINLLQAKDIHQQFCQDAESLDKNKQLHTLLRFQSGKSRLEFKGKLGGSLVLLTMAEFVRRAYESVYNVAINEEDESGFGVTPSNYKENQFGYKRLLDGDEDAQLSYIMQFGFNTGVRAKWYVEGETEYGFLKKILDGYNTFEIINLKGQFVQAKGKGLAFRDSLRNDKNSRVFSFISLDADRTENVKHVQNAAKADDFVGRFFINEPDFEYANFKQSELEDIIWKYALINDANDMEREIFISAVAGSTNMKELEERAKKSILPLVNFSKGFDWGEALSEYALEKLRNFGNNEADSIPRPMIDAIKNAFGLVYSNDFQYYMRNKRVNPETGVLERRE